MFLYVNTVLSQLIDNTGTLNKSPTIDTEIEIWADKTDFLLQEQIWIYYKVTHYSGAGLNKKYITAIHEKFKIIDQFGNIYKCKLSINPMNDRNMYIGEIVSGKVEVATSYSNEVCTANMGAFPVGKLIIYCEFNIGRKYYKSNELELNILEPEGIEREAFNLYKSALSEFFSNNIQKNEKANSFLKKIYTNYPNSVYASMAINFSLTLGGGDKEKKVKLLIEKYPNSHYLNRPIRILKRIKSKNELNDYFSSIIDTTSNIKLKTRLNKELIK